MLFGAHVYLATRLVDEPGVPAPWRVGLWLAIGLGAFLVLLQPIAERWFPPRVARCIAWPASLWMGFAFLLLVQLLLTDVVLGLIGLGLRSVDGGLGEPEFVSRLRAALVVGVAGCAGLVGLRIGLGPPVLVREEIPLARWPVALDGLRIAQISDIHIGPIRGRRFAEQLTRRVNALAADIIAITGDLVDGNVERIGGDVEPFGALHAPLGVYFVTGNHDYFSGARDWTDKVRELGLRVLRNERVSIETRGAGFDLVGVDDHRGDFWGGEGREDLEAALAGRDPERPALLLAHDPATFVGAAKRGIDLQLSGHTHGGQIFPFGLLVRLATPFVAGRYRRGDAEIYVSRGTGFWGPPMRLFAPAEITEVVLRAGESGPPAGTR